MFLTIGTVCGGYHHFVRPIASISWWAGLPLHIFTSLPMITAIYAMAAIMYIGPPYPYKLFWRWVAIMIPLLGMLVILKLTLGTFQLMDYTRLR